MTETSERIISCDDISPGGSILRYALFQNIFRIKRPIQILERGVHGTGRVVHERSERMAVFSRFVVTWSSSDLKISEHPFE